MRRYRIAARAGQYQSWTIRSANLISPSTRDTRQPGPPAFDAAGYDGGTRVWLDYRHGRLRRGETWVVRYGVMDTLNNRVVPLLGLAGHSVRAELGDGVIDQLNKAAPVSGDVDELRRSLVKGSSIPAGATLRLAFSGGSGRGSTSLGTGGIITGRVPRCVSVPSAPASSSGSRSTITVTRGA